MAVRRRYQAQQNLPEEYDGLFATRERLQPELRLMLAVLEDAFARFQRHLIAGGGPGTKGFQEVEDWFMSEDDHDLYSLETICTSLDIDASCLRRRLQAWRAQVESRRNGCLRVEPLEFLVHSRKKAGL